MQFEPKYWKELNEINNPHKIENLHKATEADINSLKENKTWELVDPPINKRVIGPKRTFKHKIDNSEKIQCYKARFVANVLAKNLGNTMRKPSHLLYDTPPSVHFSLQPHTTT